VRFEWMDLLRPEADLSETHAEKIARAFAHRGPHRWFCLHIWMRPSVFERWAAAGPMGGIKNTVETVAAANMRYVSPYKDVNGAAD
jgi:hypothetical protein